MTRHAILGPSAADKWVNCPPSARFEEQIPNEDSPFAREGTLAHELAALILAVRAGVFELGNDRFIFELEAIRADVLEFYGDEDTAAAEFTAMYEHAEGWAEFVKKQFTRDSDLNIADEYELAIEWDGEPPREVMAGFEYALAIEREYEVAKYVPLGYGTSDATVKTPRVLYVNDYKFGAGKRVNAHKNKQGLLYALGALKAALKSDPNYAPRFVVVSIYQPRVSNGETSFEIPTGELLEWAEEVIKPAANLAIAGQGDFKVGPHCQFCKAKTVCKKYFDTFAEIKKIHDKRTMTAKELETVLNFGSVVSGWVKKVEEDTARRMQSGQVVKGFKLVAGGTRRTFTSEADVIDAAMGTAVDLDKLFKTDLISLTDIEKIVGKKNFEKIFGHVIFEKEFQPKVVPEDHPAPAIGRTAHDDYEDDVI